MQALPQGILTERHAVHRDDRKVDRDRAALRKIEQRRHQLAPGQVARASEDDKDVRFELLAVVHGLQPLVQSV